MDCRRLMSCVEAKAKILLGEQTCGGLQTQAPDLE
jgi:hypothetical protein